MNTVFDYNNFEPDEWEEDTLPKKTVEELRKKIELPDGTWAMECGKCHKSFGYAEANQKDETFRCYECRENGPVG